MECVNNFFGRYRIARPYKGKGVVAAITSISKYSIILCAVVACSAASALPQNPELQQRFAAAREAAAENKQRLQQYHWVETTQLTLKGDEKPPVQNSCRYGPDGQIEKTPLGPPPDESNGRGLKGKVVEKKKAEMQEYMQNVKSVLAMYVPPDPQRMQQAYQAGNVALNPVAGAVNLIFTNYAQPGDKMTLTFDTAAKKITHLSVDTYMGEAKDAINLNVQMGTLPDGTNYPQQTILNAAAKQLTVTTTNSNYEKL
jgi:hypothetical protein